MIDINLDCNIDYKKYDNDDVYREQLLKVFNLEEFDISILQKKQDQLFTDLKKNNLFQNLLDELGKKYNYLDEELNYLVLYSYDFFDLFYIIIKNKYKNTLGEEDFLNIINQINRK